MSFSEKLDLVERLGAYLCDECGEPLGKEYDRRVEAEGLRFCSKDKRRTGERSRFGYLSCNGAYFTLGHDRWKGPKFSWIVED